MLAERIGPAELLELAGRRACREFQVEPGRMPRLASILADDSDVEHSLLAASVEARHGPEGYPELWIRLSGVLQLACQRCLGRLNYPVELEYALTVVASDAEASAIAEPFDTVVMGPEGISVSRIIEDELLAALPMAPMHEASACEESEVSQRKLMDDVAGDPERTNRPFADLAALMGRDVKNRAD